jgi:hypothetical protein
MTQLPSQQIREKLSAEQRELHDWLYEATRTPEVAVMIIGAMEIYASEHADATLWDCVRCAREHIELVYERTRRTQ